MRYRPVTLWTVATTASLACVASAAACPDVDGNGVVDIDDAVAVVFDWGTDGSVHGGDVNGDGHVNVDDLVAVLVSWGPLEVPCAPVVPPDDLDIRFWYGDQQVFGELGRPQNQANVLGNVHAVHGLESLTWSIGDGPPRPLSVGPDQRRLAEPGDFNIELFYEDVPTGVSEIRVRAVDLQGHELVRTVHVDVRPKVAWPLPYSIDWAEVGDLDDVIDVSDGRWERTVEGLRCTVADYDRLAVLGDVTWQEYEMTVPVTVHAVDESGYEWPSLVPAVGVVFRWTGHSDLFNRGAQPNQGWWPLGAAFEYVFRRTGCGGRLELYGNPFALRDEDAACGLPMELDQTYVWKMRVRTTAKGHRYRFKVWQIDEPEPDQWLLTTLEDLGQPGSGSIGLLAHHVEVTFGNVMVVPLD